MRRFVFCLVVAACSTPPRPAPIVPVAAPATKPTALPTPAAPDRIDELAVKARSHAFFDAYDRHDLDGVVADLSPAFVMFEDARFLDGALLRKMVTGRAEAHAAVRSRTWSDEHVFASGNSAVFIGRDVEKAPAEADHGAMELDGYNTLVWVRDGDRWALAHWQWARAGIDAERERWNEAFRNETGFNLKPNQLLVDTVKGRKPGTALDVAMGQGRNALFLAQQGWKTTGVDIADEGMRKAKDRAAQQKLKLETINADVDKFDFGKDKWDLVTLIYAGDNAATVEHIIPSIKKGGLFVCEYFHADSDMAKGGAGGWKTGQLAELFKTGFKILRDDVVEDNADWAGQRKTKLVRFVAQKL
jgi:SAM-dependent methyltransferase